jgi:DNA-binding NarL/FixJ family response regulator
MIARKASTAPSRRKQILIVEDHPIVREGLALTVGKTPDLAVSCQVETAHEALKAMACAAPDMVLADLTLPDRNGIELIKDIQALHPKVPVLVLSMHDEWLFAERCLRAGARGYIMKVATPAQLLGAIREVIRGGVYVSEQIGRRIIANATKPLEKGGHSPTDRLTDRQIEILQLIGQGLNTREIATQLRVSPKTIAAHQFNLKRRLNLSNVRALIRYAVEMTEGR